MESPTPGTSSRLRSVENIFKNFNRWDLLCLSMRVSWTNIVWSRGLWFRYLKVKMCCSSCWWWMCLILIHWSSLLAGLLRSSGVPGLEQCHILCWSQCSWLLLPLLHQQLRQGCPHSVPGRGRHEDPHLRMPGQVHHQDSGQCWSGWRCWYWNRVSSGEIFFEEIFIHVLMFSFLECSSPVSWPTPSRRNMKQFNRFPQKSCLAYVGH